MIRCLSLVGIETWYKIWTAEQTSYIRCQEGSDIFPFLNTFYFISKGTRSNIRYCHFLKLGPFSCIQNKAKINPLWLIVHDKWIPSFEKGICSLTYIIAVFFCGFNEKWIYFISLQNWKWSRMHQVSVAFYRRFFAFFI